jgi:predicted DNA-binding protein YlxM (UPF0122 family)
MTQVSEKILKALWDKEDLSTINLLKQQFFYQTVPNWEILCSEKQKAIIRSYYLESHTFTELIQQFNFKNLNTASSMTRQSLAKLCKKAGIDYKNFVSKLNKIVLDFTVQKLTLDYSSWELILYPKEKTILSLALGLSGENPLSLKEVAKKLKTSRQLTYAYYQKATTKIKQYHQNPVFYDANTLSLILPIIRKTKSRYKFSLELGLSLAYYSKLESGMVERITPHVFKKLTEFKPLQEYLSKITDD